MKQQKSITILAICISVLAAAAAAIGIFSAGGPGKHAFTTIHGEQVILFGKGLYRFDSVSMAAQAIAQDVVTLCLGVPLLIVSIVFARRGSLRGRLLLAGTLAYFLYTYMSYSFTSMYNSLFLADVALMSMSFFAFVLTMMSFDTRALSENIGDRFPAKPIAVFLLFLGTSVGLMWLGKIEPSLLNDTVPSGLEQYTTLVIQAMDLGFIVPVSWLTAILLLRKNPFGLLLGTVVCMKAATMLTALTAMVIGQVLAGVAVPAAVCVLFPAANAIAFVFLFVLLRTIKEPANKGGKAA
ncbi:hypothetical protein [Ethanoligenens harbinense]|uniref:Uncharacterized protein n=1 Tax=Ethanoligenens harbinense (strain DSM 18485 / JCM 12961 / CGMCC 1.5033 / YUAN-3) TaxID=663278 RepID=E6U673_ETHHY|nr:hypothetical protein [Ethanoligenens harbinense]ADU26840.1 hypothetical protein Ethha_1300 [Ethanoligenens harbinense YUAN-3]AVQ95946.1 hypothetical protein CXQ68_06695 [Ethanoligenens harbinense YUAN-3]AYF38608.1 hypothetical protein CXP51_06565 [Ethanoligenens harbinense]AYF41354.1 hypothetical protein CN246_06700 [Ethanoligenens harbinense]QCN92187.1 hypothetical protein DRA42_06720 [Ethanoligenens harbinense]